MNLFFAFLYFFKQVYKAWFLTFVGIIGLASGIIQIFPFQDKTYITNLAIFLFCLFLSVLATLLIYRIKHVPDDELWMLETPTEKPTIAFPYEKSFLRPANNLARSLYGKHSLRGDVVRKWYEKNPLTLTCLTDAHNKFVGYFDILPLTQTFGKRFVSGHSREKDIRSQHILSPSEMRDAKYIYIAGVSVKDPMTTHGKKYGAMLIYSLMVHLQTFYNLNSPKKIYATAATECGRNVLERLQFRIETDGENRRDKLDLYARVITNDDIKDYRKSFNFLENKLDYSAYTNPIQTVTPQRRRSSRRKAAASPKT